MVLHITAALRTLSAALRSRQSEHGLLTPLPPASQGLDPGDLARHQRGLSVVAIPEMGDSSLGARNWGELVLEFDIV